MKHNFENLDVWRRAVDLSVEVYESLRDCRDYTFKDQMLRSSISIFSNIAEGAERDSHNEFLRFLRIASGPAGELRTQIIIAGRVGILDHPVYSKFQSELKELSKMLYGLINSSNKT